jgi:probable regulatory domain-containing protein
VVKILSEAPVSRDVEIEKEARELFLKAIEILGGPRQLFEYRRLTWLPSLMEAAFVLSLAKRGKMAKEIAQELGLSTQTVRLILAADEESVRKKIFEGKVKKIKDHIAGGLIKLAAKAEGKEQEKR